MHEFLDAIQGVDMSSMKVESSKANHELMFIDIKLNCKQTHATVDRRETRNFISNSKLDVN